MNIGILTYHSVPNFGAQLQALSTVGCLKLMGHNPIIINWYPEDLERMYSNRIPSEQIQIHQQFMNENLLVSKLCRTEKDLIEVISECNIDLIVTGSDALFKYVPKKKRRYFSLRKFRYVSPCVISCEDFPGNPFFCDYYDLLEKKIPVVALSVSSQNCPYQLMDDEERTNIGKALRNFRTITVRDEWTKSMVETLTSTSDIQITPDPVFAFNNNCYIHIPTKKEIQDKYSLPDKYILFSFSKKLMCDEYVQSIIIKCKLVGCIPVALPMPEGLRDFGLEKKIKLPLSPIDWYALIKYSNGYIGERMHPIVVCLHNSVPFYCFDEYGVIKRYFGGLFKKHDLDSSKTYHIIKRFNLLDNFFSMRKKGKLPTAEIVIKALFSFDTVKCKQMADKMSHDFINVVCDLIKNASKKK